MQECSLASGELCSAPLLGAATCASSPALLFHSHNVIDCDARTTTPPRTPRSLDKAGASVTVLDRRSHFYHNAGAIRHAVADGWGDGVFIPRRFPREGRFVQATVTKIRDGAVEATLAEDGKTATFEYDYVVMATGSQARFPAKVPFGEGDDREVAETMYAKCRDAVAAARRILVVGGGPTGIELAGEIATHYNAFGKSGKPADTNKEIVLVHSRPKLLTDPGLSDELADKLQLLLARAGVKVLCGQRIAPEGSAVVGGGDDAGGADAGAAGAGAAEAGPAARAGDGSDAAPTTADGELVTLHPVTTNHPEGSAARTTPYATPLRGDVEPDLSGSFVEGTKTYTTTADETIEADLTIWTVGARADATLQTDWLGADGVDAHGRVKVDDHLRIVGKANAWCLGDVSDVKEGKMFAMCMEQAKYVVPAIVDAINGKPAGKKAYKTHPPIQFVTVGFTGGAGQLPNGKLAPGPIVKFAKGRDMMVGRVHKMVGVPKPALPKNGLLESKHAGARAGAGAV